MKKVRKLLGRAWQPTLTMIIGAAAAIATLGYRLGSLTQGLSKDEVNALSGTTKLIDIAQNPLFLPFKLGQYVLYKLGIDWTIALRGVSALIGLACVWGFYLLLKRWNTKRIAVLGTIMFISSTWFLSAARTATPTILYVFNTLSIIFIAALVHQKKASKTSLLLAAICASLLVYSPGMIWLLIIGGIWQYKGIIALLKQNRIVLWAGACIVAGVLLLPAGYAVMHNWRFLLDIAAIPDSWIPLEIAKRFGLVPLELFVRGPEQVNWLAKLPIMDLFTGAMLVIGVYTYYLRYTLIRTKFVVWLSGLLIILIALFSLPTVMLLPIVYILIVTGITLIIQQWFTVFPFNPIARRVGLCMLIAAVGISCWFQLYRYFVAWPHNQTTTQSYHHRLVR